MALANYTKTTYVNDQEPAINDTNMNNNEDHTEAITSAVQSLESTVADIPTTYESIAGNTIAKTDEVNTFTVAQKDAVSFVTYAANIAFDMDTSNNFSVTLTANVTLDNPTNITLTTIQTGVIQLVQDTTGGWTLSLGTSWVLVGVDSTDTTAGKINIYRYTVINSTTVLYEFLKAV